MPGQLRNGRRGTAEWAGAGRAAEERGRTGLCAGGVGKARSAPLQPRCQRRTAKFITLLAKELEAFARQWVQAAAAPDSCIVPSAPPRAGGRGQRRRPGRRSACLFRGAPRGSAGPRARPLPPAPWEAKVTACTQSGSRPLPSWKSGSSVPYLSSV